MKYILLLPLIIFSVFSFAEGGSVDSELVISETGKHQLKLKQLEEEDEVLEVASKIAEKRNSLKKIGFTFDASGKVIPTDESEMPAFQHSTSIESFDNNGDPITIKSEPPRPKLLSVLNGIAEIEYNNEIFKRSEKEFFLSFQVLTVSVDGVEIKRKKSKRSDAFILPIEY